MELRYIEYAGGNFTSCRNSNFRAATERSDVADVPANEPTHVALADDFIPEAAKLPVTPSETASRPVLPVDARALFGSGELPDPVPVRGRLKIAPVATEAAGTTPAPAGVENTPPPFAVAPAAGTSAIATPAAATPEEVTAQALQRLAERRAREAAKHAEREAERKKRQEALAADRREREAADQSKRTTAQTAKDAARRARRDAKEIRQRERILARVRKKVGIEPRPPKAPASPARKLAANLAAGVGLLAAVGASIWYFAGEHGRFEREARQAALAAAAPGPSALKSAVAQPSRAPRVQQGSLLAIAALENAVERRNFQHVVRVQRGEYFRDLLMRSGVNGADSQLAQISLAGVYDVRKMRAGQLITIDFGILGEEHNRFLGVRFDSNYDRTVWIQRQSRGDYVATEIKKELTLELLRNNGTIDNSVFQAALQAGMPPEPVVRMINLFAYDVDFQRDVQKGDTFETLIEQHKDRNGDVVRYGNILYASMTVQGSTIKLYRWQGDDGEADYFNEKGESSRKALMRTPIEGARLSSGFGYRRHPILGYSKLHQGVDFAAPTGTPIYAAGTGQIEKVGWHGGYGNAVIIRHTKEYSTLYGHMSGFAPGMQAGKRVKQGEIIGYVGTTGMSTGPHLHYEVHLSGKQIDPLSLKLPSRQRLAGPELQRYLEYVKTIELRWQMLAKNGGTGQGIVMAGDQEADTGCVNGTRLDPTDKRACE